jgi:hypothetical protein
MAFLENGSPVATKLGPIATLQTSIAGKAAVTSIFTIPNTTRTWLLMPQLTAGTYNCVTSVGTATLFVYDTSNDLIQEIAVTSTAASTAITVDFNRIEIEANQALDISITPSNAKITTAGGTMSLQRLSSGNYATAGGTAGNYTQGQYAHVVVVGGGGGGGGFGGYAGLYAGGTGGAGGVSASTTAFPLTGTYALVAGTGGTLGAPGHGNFSNGDAGGAGNASTGFGLTSNAGAGGPGASYNSPGGSGTAGTPSGDPDTDIYKPSTRAKLGYGAGGGGTQQNPTHSAGANGTAGGILVLKWTP